MTYFQLSQIIRNPYVPFISLTLYAAFTEAFIQIFISLPQESSSYFDIQNSTLVNAIQQLPKLPLICISIFLAFTNWQFTNFTTFNYVLMKITLSAMFLIEKTTNFEIAQYGIAAIRAVHPFLVLSASFGLVHMKGRNVSIFGKILFAAISYFIVQFSFILPLLYFRMGANGHLMTGLQSDQYINRVQKILIVCGCIACIVHIFSIQCNKQRVYQNLQYSVADNIRLGKKRQYSIDSAMTYFNPVHGESIGSQQIVSQITVYKIEACCILFCMGILFAIGTQSHKIYDCFQIQPFPMFPLWTKLISFIVCLLCTVMIVKNNVDPMLVIFCCNVFGILFSLSIVILALFDFENNFINILSQKVHSLLPVLITAASKGFFVVGVFYLNQFLQNSPYLKRKISLIQIAGLICCLQYLFSFFVGEILKEKIEKKFYFFIIFVQIIVTFLLQYTVQNGNIEFGKGQNRIKRHLITQNQSDKKYSEETLFSSEDEQEEDKKNEKEEIQIEQINLLGQVTIIKNPTISKMKKGEENQLSRIDGRRQRWTEDDSLLEDNMNDDDSDQL